MAANFCDQILLCFSNDGRPRRKMLVCVLSCLFSLQSDNETQMCRGTAGSLSEKITFVHPCGFSIIFLKNSAFAIGLEQ